MQSVNSDAFRCAVCGMMVWVGMTHACGGTPTFSPTPPYTTAGACTHCYCRITSPNTSDPAHRLCCNCGNRQAMG